MGRGPDRCDTSARYSIRTGDLRQARAAARRHFHWMSPCSSTAHKARLLATASPPAGARTRSQGQAAIVGAIEQARRPGCRLLGNVLPVPWRLSKRTPRIFGALFGTPDQRRDGGTEHGRGAGCASASGELTDGEVVQVRSGRHVAARAWRDALGSSSMQTLASVWPLANAGVDRALTEDVPRLRVVAKSHRGTPDARLAGCSPATRTAGRSSRTKAECRSRSARRSIEGSSIRRKVLGLLCLLVSRPRFSAARDEVLDALWPDFDPSDALNSLNQTVYFLRRVFEPTFQEDLSPGYLNHEGDLVWLDSDLVESRSQRCWDLIRALPVEPIRSSVVTSCRRRIEDRSHWTSPTRSGRPRIEPTSSRHTSKSSRVRSTQTPRAGHFERGIVIARRALEACPEADSVELSLLRLYKLSGSHAAAAEQYTHYSTWLRDSLGRGAPDARFLVGIGKVPY